MPNHRTKQVELASVQVVLIDLALTNEGDEEFSIAEDVFSFEPFAMAIKRFRVSVSC